MNNGRKSTGGGMYSPLPSGHRYRSKRRRRRMLVKNTLLCLLALSILVGIVLIVRSCNDRAVGLPNGTETTTEALTTEISETSSGILEKGHTIVNVPNSALHEGDLILVKSGVEYVFPSDDSNMLNIFSNRKKYPDGSRAYQLSGANITLDSHVLSMLNGLAEEFYEKTGENGLLVSSAYRTKEEQQSILDTRIEQKGEAEALKYVALPGESEHHTGYAFDMSVYKDGVNTYIQDNEEYLWINENAHRYGLILRYPEDKVAITGINYEGWHFRYVGHPHAYYMYSENLCLEEYIDLLSTSHTYDTAHLKVTESGNDGVEHEYEIYYVSADEGDSTAVIVPLGYEYVISGDNVGGFIVTVSIK